MLKQRASGKPNKLIRSSLALLACSVALTTAHAESHDEAYAEESTGRWGIGVSWRHGSVPYQNDSADSVRTMIPQVYYEGERVFMRDLEWGVKAYDDGDNQINGVIKRRFVSIPRRLQNVYQEDALDWGVQWLHRAGDHSNWRVEALTETNSRYQIYAGHDWQLQYGKLELKPRAGLRYKSNQFNSHYYGHSNYPELNGKKINGGIESEVGFGFRYQLFAGLHLTGDMEYIYLDSEARNAPNVNSSGMGAVRLWVSFISMISIPPPEPLFPGSPWRKTLT